MSYCRITGRSRGLPKPNYFPLLPPISPADAKRFCRITGKSYGLPTHHYIPVLLGVHSHDKSKCKITNASEYGPHHFTAGYILGEKKKHVVLQDYRYVFPILKAENEQQKALWDLLASKHPYPDEETSKFVYTVKERRCSLVFPANLEAAVRDGDVRDVMLSRDCDTVMLRLKQGKNVSVDFQELSDFDNLYEGLGPREDVVKAREKEEAETRKRKKKREAKLSYAKKIFEDKEKADEEEELKRAKQVKLRSIKEEVTIERNITDWKHVDIGQERTRGSIVMSTNEWNDFVKPLDHSFDWEKFAQNGVVSVDETVVKQLPKPLNIKPQTIDLEKNGLGNVCTPISEETAGFEAISVVKPFKPLTAEPNEFISESLKTISAEELEGTLNVNKKLEAAGAEVVDTLPRVNEIPTLVQSLDTGKKIEINKVKGLKVDIESAQRFIAGQTIETPHGPVFVPGQTLQTPVGPTFVPGFTVHTPDGPMLIPGQIIPINEDGKLTPVFVAGQTLDTQKGQKFIQGQTLHTSVGAKFVEGQTVLTKEGPKFVAGQISEDGSFIPGQTVITSSSPKFMPGQTTTDQYGEPIFVAGQSVENNGNWEFVPGQCVRSSTDELQFIPGQTMLTTEGPRFVPGQNVQTNEETHFVPGITVKSNEKLEFVPGLTMNTPEGLKFVQGQMVKTPDGEKFLPGLSTIGPDGFKFAAAKSLNDITFLEAAPTGIPIDPKIVKELPHVRQQEIFGHVIKTEKGVEFVQGTPKKFPSNVGVVPGQLVRDETNTLRFVPGLMTENGFLPGQIVTTEKGEMFVPGQVIDTVDGPKFVPGRTIETRTGPKFVPGQNVETPEGPQFVPGQIVETKVGPTFIPGQIISTEDEGSKFVPGQVVDTPDGPRFVPGRIVESEELGVTFVPGQIVQTEHGPRFVAPDLTDTPEGEFEFSVQGFEVTPEELNLLKVQNASYSTSTKFYGDISIDSRIMKQLSEAGMSVGNGHGPFELPHVDIDVDPTAVALEHALIIAEKIGLHGNSAVKMAQIVSTVAQLAKNIVQQSSQQYHCLPTQNGTKMSNGHSMHKQVNGHHEEEGSEEQVESAIKNAVAAAIVALSSDDYSNNEEQSQSYVFSVISEAFNVLLRGEPANISESVDVALKILLVPENRNSICKSAMCTLLEESNNKIDILKSTVVSNIFKEDVILERLAQVLEEEGDNDLIAFAFKNLSKGDPDLVAKVLQKVSLDVADITTEKEAADRVHKAIVQAVRESSESHVKELLSEESTTVREMILQAVGLAKALGLASVASTLLAVISDETSTRALAGDKVTFDILKRLTVMRKLAESRPQYVSALRDLCSDPEMARKDPRLRTLVRESAALMIVPEEAPLQSSVDIPMSLLNAENSLAIEDFLMRKKRRASSTSSIIMILKQGLQAVVPKEAARSVLKGEVAYTVLDEEGIRHFEPMHVFSALKLNKPATHRFSMYHCPVVHEDDIDTELLTSINGGRMSASSLDESTLIDNGYLHRNSLTSEKTAYSLSRENTPSFRRISSLLFDTDFGRKSENFIVIKEFQGETEDFALNVGDIVEAVEYADPSKKSDSHADLDVGSIEDRLDNSAAKHKMSVRPRRNHLDPRARGVSRSSLHSNASSIFVRTIEGREGWIPMSFVMQTALSEESSTMTSHHKPEDSKYRREAVIKELVETEEEFGRDLQNVVERYMKPLDNPDVPRIVRDNKDLIFSNLKQIADFHNTVLIEGVKYYADQPRMLGKTFLRLERDFDKHVAYCRDEPHAQEFLLLNDEVREYFEERSQTLGDDKTVAEHLKLPIQRINDYQLLLKELVKYSTRLGEDCADLQKALELMLSIPHRAADNKFISNIEGYKGNIHKLGRLLTHEWYTVVDKEGKSKERYLFLFKARILVCKVKRISEDRSVFVLKDIIRIPEVEVKDHTEDLRVFELHQPGASDFPLTLIAHKDPVKAYWLKEIRQYTSDVVALAEHAADDLQLTEEPEVEEEYKVPTTPELFHVAKPEDEVLSSPEPVIKRKEVPIEKTLSYIETPTPLSTTPLIDYPETPDLSSKKSYQKLDLYKKYYQEEEDELEAIISTEKKKKERHEYQYHGKPDPKRAWPGEPPVPERREDESDTKRSRYGAWPGDPQQTFEGDDQPNMSRRYSSSRYSASSRHYEEYSAVSSTRNGVTAHRESSVSSVGGTRRYSATMGGEKIMETSSAYEHTKVDGNAIKDVEMEEESVKLALTSNEPSKPTFSKTLEGSNIEQIRTDKAMVQTIAGETATFECVLTSKDDSTQMQWLKDNKPMDDALADRVKITTEHNVFKLKIENVMESDSGIYIARATNNEGGASCTAQLIVEKLTPEEKRARLMANAPIFLVQLKDTELLLNTYLRFMIKVKGRPTPEVKFFKNGQLIDEHDERVKVMKEKADKGFYELLIPDVQEEDAGQYSCTATNKCGEASCEATLTVVDEKTIFTGLPEGMAEPGEEPKFVWTRDGVQFDPEERFKVLFKDNEDTLALVFQHVKPEDAGLYTCVAQTSSGNISCSAELTVQGTVNQLVKDPTKPVLASESKASECTAGGSAMLDMQIKGFPKPDIKWLKDGVELIPSGRIKYLWEDEESLSLVIKSVTSRDAGTYTCTAKNELGEDSTQIELIVKSAPKIIKKLSSLTVLTKETLTLEVQIMSSPAPEVKWYKGGKLIEESDRISMVKEGEEIYKLVVKDVQMEDAGSYTVVAKNDINQTSDMCDVKVKYPPRILKRLEKTQILEEFDSLTLLVEVDADPKPTVTWFKNDQVLEETEKISITQENDTHIVKITGCVHTDSASYKVKVQNQDGIAEDQSDVTVRCKPTFTVPLGDTHANEGTPEFELLCRVESFEKPTVKWYIGDVEITGESRQLTPLEDGNNYKLRIRNITTDLAGVYSCKAENECGLVESKATFDVYTKPKFLKKVVEQVKLKEGDALNLKVEVEGSPDPVVTWYKDGKAVSADAHIKITRDSNRKESYSLTVDLVKLSDGGKYEVRAQNDMGTIVGSSKVIILTKSEEVVEEEQKPGIEDMEKAQQAAEGPEGYTKTEKKVEVVRNAGDTITISTASTTTHEAILTGPDESHCISKMTSTKVECQEMNIGGPVVEEIASYSYTVHEENEKAQNGVLVEEFTDSEDKRTNFAQNRGVSIVSVSDDESTLKGISRDVSSDEIHATVITEEVKITNGSYEELNGSNEKHAEEHIIERSKPMRGNIVVETIMEEKSIDESISEVCSTPVSEKGNGVLSRKMSKENSTESHLSRQTSLQEDESLQRSKVIEESGKKSLLSSRSSTIEAQEIEQKSQFSRQSSTYEAEEKTTVSRESLDEFSTNEKRLSRESIVYGNNGISRQNSTQADISEVAESKKSGRRFSKETAEIMEQNSSRKNSIRQSDLSESTNLRQAEIGKSSYSRHNSVTSEVNVSRRTSTAEMVELEKSQQGVAEQSSIKRHSLDKRSVSTENKYAEIENLSRKSSLRAETDEIEEDETMKALFDRIKKQRSVLDEILDKQQGDVEDEENSAPPSIVSSTLKDREVFETQSCRFEIKTTGIPRPEAKWFKDGEPLKQSEKIKWGNSGDNYYMTVNRCEPEDQGIYSVILASKLGSCAADGNLTVAPVDGLRKPKFIKPLTDGDTLKDGQCVFKAVVTGEPVPDVTWYFDGEELPTETGRNAKWKEEMRSEPIQDGLKECTYQLKVNKCDEIDVGKYSIKVTNQYGEDQCSADLTLLEAPIIEEFKDLRAPAGEQCSWEAVVRANPKPDMIWTKGDKILNEDEHFGVEEDFKRKSYKLIIKNVEDEDVGTYKVKAINEYGDATATAELTTYTEAPAFVTELKDESVRDANDHEVILKITGFPRPEIRWFKDDKEIREDDKHVITAKLEGPHVVAKLIIKKYSDNDTGVLQCVATNPYGEIETQGRLTLTKFPPKFSATLPGSLDIDEGDKLELVAAVDGSPIPLVKWLKDGEEIKPDDHVKLEILPSGSMKLTINKVTPTDSGSYKVVASNPNGDRFTACSVAVMPEKKKPCFIKELENKKLIIGEPLLLEVQVLAIPNPQVQWFKDGQPIRQTTGFNFETQPNGTMCLTIDQVRPENAGTYSVVVSNPLGEATSEGVIEVEEKETLPTFIGSLQPMTVVEGFPVKLEIKSIGKPQPVYKWSHNGKQIEPDGQHIKIIDMPDGSQALLIDKATAEDAGEYEVLAINSKGMTPTKGVLTIASKTNEETPEEKPAFICPLRDLAVDEGELIKLSAPIKGNPVPDVLWTKDGKPLRPSERVILSCDGKNVTLEINPSTLKDSGSYVCKLRNPLGSDSATAQATVRNKYQAPSFIQKFTDIEQSPNTDAKFCARVTGVPLPDISWYYNGSPLSDSDKYKIKRDGDACSLFIKNCTLADSGRYKCEATNKDGKVACDAKLSVIDQIDKKQKVEPPAFLKRIGDCEVYKGMTAKFTACMTGYPEPEFEWYRDDNKIWPTDRILMDHEGSLLRLSIYNVDECDAGVYKLRIFNSHGEDTCKADMMYETLDIRKKHLSDQYLDYDKYRKTGLPLPLSHPPIISRMMDRNLTLSWKPSIPIGPRTPVTYLVEMCELPDGDWFTSRSGIRGCLCEIRNLVPFHDYKFRIRVENKHGVSDPSPFVQTYRARLEPEAPTFFPYLAPGVDFRPDNSPYFPKDFDIERPPYDNYAQAPRFLRQEHETQYGVKNHNCNLFWFVYGYPKPRMSYYFNNELIESGGRYDQSYTRNGQATLFINKMLDRDAGFYEAVATNEHGEARQRVRLDIAEYPTFIQRPEETYIMLRKSGRIEARVIGVPYPDIKWYKDWKPLTTSTRIHITFAEPDKTILTIEDAISKDDGLYSISARNVAGCISSSVMMHIEEDEHEYGYKMYTRKYEITPRQKPYGDFYDIGDELGRGTQGITYHGVERQTGKHFACKVMNGGDEYKHYMYSELEAYNHLAHRNLLRLHDAFETPRSMTLVIEIAGGGELVDTLIRRPYYTEYEISGYIRQILWGLDYMHSHSWAHLGLNLGDILLSHPGCDDLKLGDFGLARRIEKRLMSLYYGMPEYVAPEVVNGEGVSFGTDMWSVGIITYILLSGVSPFRGINDRETLTKIKEGKWSFDERWTHISDDAKDFIRKLLEYQDHRRLDVKAALNHRWLTYADRTVTDCYQINSENLKNYYKTYRDWYNNASCRTWYRRRKLSSAFEHPSKMVYPPGHRYTPELSPERTFSPVKRPPPKSWESKIPSREPIDTEIGVIKSESHYQNGPDTYLLQLRDTDFPVRLREYMKVAHGRGFSRPVYDDNYDWGTPIIRERRRFTDIMDEEIDDERKARINTYSNVDTGTLRRLRHELGTRLDSYAEAEALMECKKGGHMPFFREKPQIRPIQDGKPAELACYAVGEPKPIIQWFKNDLVIQESNRVKVTDDEEGRSILSFNPAREHDIGIYKVVARNRIGQTVARTRILVASVPCAPDSPEGVDASESEILLRWKQPKYDGNSPVLCYNLQYKEGDSIEWKDVAHNIDHEFFLVKNLKPNTSYQFRLAARNRIGWSEKGIPTKLLKTREGGLGVPKVQMSRAMIHLQELTESGQEIEVEDHKINLDYAIEDEPINWITDVLVTSKYSFMSELARGQFSVVAKGLDKSTDKVIVAKISEFTPKIEAEFEALRSLRHEKIALLEAAYKTPKIAVFIMEKLQGADVLTYLSSRHEYTENCVATIITQILDALQYLHWRGYCHLDIQPDNVVMASVRSVHIKLVDFGSAHKVTKLGNLVPQVGHPEYRSPEVLNEEPAYPHSDIWMVGVLTYVLLSGASPFKGNDAHETKQNITFVRFRFEYLYKELSQEATRFLMLVFKRMPSKRPTAEECHEHRWLLPTEYMIKRRERAVFLGNRLKDYSEEYHAEKQKLATQSDSLKEAFGSSRQLMRSNSIQDELLTTI